MSKENQPQQRPEADYFRQPLTPTQRQYEALRASFLEGLPATVVAERLARREVLVAAGGYCDRFSHAEDFELWLRLSQAHGFANLPQPLLDYRVHPQGVSVARLREQLLATERALREMRGDLPEDIAGTAAFRRRFSDQAFLRAELLVRAGCRDEARALYETISTGLNYPWHRVAVSWASAGYLKAFNPRRRWRNLALSLAVAGLIRPGLLLKQLQIKLDFLVRKF